MSLSLLLLLLLLLVCSSQASHFFGTVMTYYPKTSSTDGSVVVVLRYKLNFHSSSSDSWDCDSGDCGTQRTLRLNIVDEEGSGEWRQTEGIMTRDVPGRAPFQLALNGGNWINNINNGVRRWRAVTLVDLRSRSDTGRANTSPQTTIMPAVRIPSNCRRDFDLLVFDPDGDEVKCRFGNTSLMECNPCTPPSVTNLSPSCTLSFSSNSSSDQGAYAVQLVMEDFPRRTITLNQTNGELTTVTPDDAISKIPIQFVLRVDSAVASCTEGLYLPRFLPPTPGNRARLYAPVNQSLEISISAEANVSTVSELLFSGPYNVNQTAAAGQYVLRWTPSQDEDGESHPFCFVAQAVHNTKKYHSDLRCVIVTVGPDPTTTVTSPTAQTQTTPGDTSASLTPFVDTTNQFVLRLSTIISSSSPLSEDDLRNTVIQQLKDELERLGLPPGATLRLVSYTTTASPPGG